MLTSIVIGNLFSHHSSTEGQHREKKIAKALHTQGVDRHIATQASGGLVVVEKHEIYHTTTEIAVGGMEMPLHVFDTYLVFSKSVPN